MSVHWSVACSKCGRRKRAFVERARKWCVQCAEKEPCALVRRALIRHRYGDDPAAYTPDVLRELAAGPIGDALILFAPAGKLTMAETKAREAAAVLSIG